MVGGAVASWLVRSTPEQAVWVRAMARNIVLCSWARHFTLTVPLSTQVYKWVPAILLLGVTLQWTSIPSRGEKKYSQLLHATETGISSGLMGHLAWMQTLPCQELIRMQDLLNSTRSYYFANDFVAGKKADQELKSVQLKKLIEFFLVSEVSELRL